jgi:hypothetical protein
MKSAMRSLGNLGALAALLGGLLASAQTAPVKREPTPNPQSTRQVQANYGNLPLTFEANQGQTDPQVKFLAHGSHYSVFLTSGQMVLSLRASAKTSTTAANTTSKATSRAPHQKAGPGANQPVRKAVIQLNLLGANPNPTVTGEDIQAGTVNYFIGNDPKKWRTKVPINRCAIRPFIPELI